MKKIAVLLCITVLLGVAFFAFRPEGMFKQATTESATVTEPTVKIDSVGSMLSSETEQFESDQAPKAKLSQPDIAKAADLEKELAVAVQQRETAEEALRLVELEVGALEKILDDIEVRGENPVDAQDETLDAFQKLFADYQDAIKDFENAEREEARINEQLGNVADQSVR